MLTFLLILVGIDLAAYAAVRFARGSRKATQILRDELVPQDASALTGEAQR